jgi:hypothetical protein
MSLDLVGQLTSLENLLKKNNTNTSTYDISDGLQHRVQMFRKGSENLHSRIPVPNNLYHIIFCELPNQSEAFAQLGNSANRNVTLNFNIIPVVNYSQGAKTEVGENQEINDLETIRLAQNIQALIRANITLSQTVQDSNISDVSYGVVQNANKAYNGMATISLEIKKLTT